MGKEEKNFFRNISCSNCGNISKMKVIGDVYDDHTEYDDRHGYGPDNGTHYFILECPSCESVNITRHYWHEHMEEDNDAEIVVEILYPQKGKVPLGLPTHIKEQFVIAEQVKTIDVSLYAISMRKLLEMVCKDRNASGGTLAKMLDDLAAKSELPQKLVDVAKGVRLFGNMGAHASDVKLENNEIPLLDSLSRAVLEYIYSAPHLATIAQQKLDNLTNK